MKPQVILLHGAIGTANQLVDLSEILRGKGFDCFLFEFSGHGKSAFSNEGFGIIQFSNELESFISKNKLIKPCVFGYSMGGYVALYLAANKPDLLGNTDTVSLIVQ